jgi:hypothetical protein
MKFYNLAALLAALAVCSFAQAQDDQHPPLRENSRIGQEHQELGRPDYSKYQSDPEDDIVVHPTRSDPPEEYCPPPSAADVAPKSITREEASRLIEERLRAERSRARKSRSPAQASRIVRIAVDNHSEAINDLRKGIYRDLYGVKWELRKVRKQFEDFKNYQMGTNKAFHGRIQAIEDLDLDRRVNALEDRFKPAEEEPSKAPTVDAAVKNAEEALKAEPSLFQKVLFLAFIFVCVAAIVGVLYLGFRWLTNRPRDPGE